MGPGGASPRPAPPRRAGGARRRSALWHRASPALARGRPGRVTARPRRRDPAPRGLPRPPPPSSRLRPPRMRAGRRGATPRVGRSGGSCLRMCGRPAPRGRGRPSRRAGRRERAGLWPAAGRQGGRPPSPERRRRRPLGRAVGRGSSVADLPFLLK